VTATLEHKWSIPTSHLCLCITNANRKKKRLTRSRLPPRVKTRSKLQILRFSVYLESRILGIANICDLLRVRKDVSYNLFFGRNLYVSKRPKSQRRTFPLSFLLSALVQVLLALVEGIGTNKTARTMDISTLRYSYFVGLCLYTKFACLLLLNLSHYTDNPLHGSYSSITPPWISV